MKDQSQGTGKGFISERPFNVKVVDLQSPSPMPKGFAVLIFSLLFSFAINGVYGQHWRWVNKIGLGGMSQQAGIRHSAIDSAGNIYILGWFYGRILLGDREHIADGLLNTNLFVAKLNPAGAIVWSNAIKGVYDDSYPMDGHQVFLDEEGGVVILGRVSRRADFGNGVELKLPGHSQQESFVARYNFDGSIAWARFGFATPQFSSFGRVMTFNQLHDGFATEWEWNNYNSTTRSSDTIYFYNAAGKVKSKLKHPWQDDVIGIIQTLKPSATDLWVTFDCISENQSFAIEDTVISVHEGDVVISRYNLVDNKFFVEGVFPSFARDGEWYITHEGIYLLGRFLSKGTINFGNLSIQSSQPLLADQSSLQEGYLIKFDLEHREFVFGIPLERMAINFQAHLAVGRDGNIYITREEVGIGTDNYLTAFDREGNLKWEKSTNAYIHEYIDVQVDTNENIYVIGNVSNGVDSRIFFDNHSFTYDYSVGFVTRLSTAPAPIPPKYVTLTEEICDGNAFTVGTSRYMTAGIYADTLQTITGGDSIITLNLSVRKVEAKITREGRLLVAHPADSEYKWIDCNTSEILHNTTNTYAVSRIGEFAVKVISGQGCESLSECVEVTCVPNTAHLSETICNGEEFLVGSKRYKQTGIYIDTLFSTIGGCDSIIHLTLQTKTIIPAIVDNGNFIQAFPDHAAYQWLTCDGTELPAATSSLLYPGASGSYRVRVSQDGCTETSGCHEAMVMGVDEKTNDLSVSPNPGNGLFLVTFPESITSPFDVVLYDSRGSLREFSYTHSNNSITIDLKERSPGMYYVKICSGKHSYFAKLLVR